MRDKVKSYGRKLASGQSDGGNGQRVPRRSAPGNQAGKFDRVVRLMVLLKAGSYITMDEMVRELGVDKRSVRRYLQSLERGGVAWHFDSVRRAYRIEKSQLLNMPQLRVEEALAVVAALSVVKKMACLKAGQVALAKVLGALPGPIRREIGELEMAPFVRQEPGSHAGTEEENYVLLREAMRDGTQVRGEYRSVSRGTCEEVVLDAYALFFQRRAWYVAGKARTVVKRQKGDGAGGYAKGQRAGGGLPPGKEGESIRIYKLVRLSQAVNTKKPFLRPKSFSLDEHLGLAWNMAPGAQRFRVRIKFDKHVSPLISETYWHQEQVITQNPDGSLLFETTVDGLNEIVWWVLSFGSHAKVEEPEELREMVENECRKMIE